MFLTCSTLLVRVPILRIWCISQTIDLIYIMGVYTVQARPFSKLQTIMIRCVLYSHALEHQDLGLVLQAKLTNPWMVIIAG